LPAPLTVAQAVSETKTNNKSIFFIAAIHLQLSINHITPNKMFNL
jgi:hypothetical protein